MHPWHDISIGTQAPAIVPAVIEVPMGSNVKYELDKDTGLIRVDRTLFSSVFYPANYGFFPQTYCDDNDPLDILILSQITIQPLCIVSAKVIGAMRMMDNGEHDDKVIAVVEDDMSVNHFNDITELPVHFLKELRNFFEDYKKLENKTVIVEDFQDAKIAKEIISKSFVDYNELMKK